MYYHSTGHNLTGHLLLSISGLTEWQTPGWRKPGETFRRSVAEGREREREREREPRKDVTRFIVKRGYDDGDEAANDERGHRLNWRHREFLFSFLFSFFCQQPMEIVSCLKWKRKKKRSKRCHCAIVTRILFIFLSLFCFIYEIFNAIFPHLRKFVFPRVRLGISLEKFHFTYAEYRLKLFLLWIFCVFLCSFHVACILRNFVFSEVFCKCVKTPRSVNNSRDLFPERIFKFLHSFFFKFQLVIRSEIHSDPPSLYITRKWSHGKENVKNVRSMKSKRINLFRCDVQADTRTRT